MPGFHPLGELPLASLNQAGENPGLSLIATAILSSISLFESSASTNHIASANIQTISDVGLFGRILSSNSAQLITILQTDNTARITISNIIASMAGIVQVDLAGAKSAGAIAKFDTINQLFDNAQVSHLSFVDLSKVSLLDSQAKINRGGEANLATIFNLEPRFALTLGGLAQLAGISVLECAARLVELPTANFAIISELSADGQTDAGEAKLALFTRFSADAKVDYINTADLFTLVELIRGGGLIHTATTILPIICTINDSGGLIKTANSMFGIIYQLETNQSVDILASTNLSIVTQFNNLSTVDRGGGINEFSSIVTFNSSASLDISETINSTADIFTVSKIFATPYTYDVESSSDGDGWSFYVCVVY